MDLAGIFSTISTMEFIDAPGCYNACRSFCCRWEHSDMSFAFIPRGGTLFYLPAEYAWMREHAKIKSQVKPLCLDFGGDKPVSLLFSYCQDCAQCGKAFERTLYCKLYPFLPMLSLDGALEDLVFISPYDVAMEFTRNINPCSLIEKKSAYLEKFSNDHAIMDILRHPYILFHLRVARHLHDVYRASLAKDISLAGCAPGKFWKRWEFAYLSGKLFKSEPMAQFIAADYEYLRRAHPGFSLAA